MALGLLMTLNLIQIVLSESDICLWGRTDDYNERINGLYSYESSYKEKPYYTKTANGQGCDYEPDTFYLYWTGYQWQISGSLGYQYKYAYCTSSDINNCQWYIYNGHSYYSDSNVDTISGSCPSWNCDQISIPSLDNNNNCNGPFDTYIDNNVWRNITNDRYWYFHPHLFKWVCDDEYSTACDNSYFAETDQGWTDLSMAENIDLYVESNNYWYPSPLTIYCEMNPTINPSTNPTLYPTSSPTINPTLIPTSIPTSIPTLSPSSNPSSNPTSNPSFIPSFNPSSNPSFNPTSNPTSNPSSNPTSKPTLTPTIKPTLKPSIDPSVDPTFAPIIIPSGIQTETSTQIASISTTVNNDAEIMSSPNTTLLSVGIMVTYNNDSFYQFVIICLGIIMCCVLILCTMILWKMRKVRIMEEEEEEANNNKVKCMHSSQRTAALSNIPSYTASCVQMTASNPMHLHLNTSIKEKCVPTQAIMIEVDSEEEKTGGNTPISLDLNGDNNHKMSDMTSKNIESNFVIKFWLRNTVKLPQYFNAFICNGYESIDFIKDIKEENELIDIGIMIKEHQYRILMEIAKLQQPQKTNMFITNESSEDDDGDDVLYQTKSTSTY